MIYLISSIVLDSKPWTCKVKQFNTKSVDLIDKYKVYISKSAGSPNKDFKVIVTPYVGEKGSVWDAAPRAEQSATDRLWAYVWGQDGLSTCAVWAGVEARKGY